MNGQQTSAKWRDYTFIGFDTETTGKYPLSAEICEIAAVKWRGGQVIGTFQSLIKPSAPMDAEVIAIHGITNQMVESAPHMSEKIGEFHAFIQGGILVAHHAPFDLGFVSLEFERVGLELPYDPVVCSSLLSRVVWPESTNHRLQTLIEFFRLQKGTAHRALDDAKACLEVAMKCMERMGDKTLQEVLDRQGGALTWRRFSIAEIEKSEVVRVLTKAAREQGIVEVTYKGGSKPGEPRRLHPHGLVRSLDGDYLIAYCEKDQRSKRYFLDKIVTAHRV